MLHLHHGNRTERLADELAALLAVPSPAGPLQQDVVMVQSAGMGRWLQLALGDRLGVCANVRFPFPAAFVWQLLHATLADLPAESPFDPDVLAWRLLGAFDRLPGDDRPWAPLRDWLAGADARGRYELACRLAATFDRYLVYRPDWIEAWERGRDDVPAAAADWQAALWRRLVADAGDAPHWVRVRERFAAALAAGVPARLVAEGRLPARVALFGVPSLSPGFLQVLAAAADALDVHVFLPNPSTEYRSHLRTPAARARAALEIDPAEAMFLDTGHPLLASLGRQSADLLDLLLDQSPQEHELFVEPAEATWLGTLQADMYGLRERGTGEGREPPLPVAAADGSIVVHSCHSPLREVEVLHDWLRDRFEREPDLDPADVVVMVPDIEDYAAAVAAVFGAEPPERRIDHALADRGLAGESALAAEFLALLESAGSRHDAASVLGLLDSTALRRRFDLDEPAVRHVRQWLEQVRVRWGIDGAARAALGLPAETANTWREGLDRLLLGYALPGDARRLFAGLLPGEDVEGGDARVLGRFAAFAEALFALPEQLARPRPAAQWARDLRWLLERFFAPDEDAADDAERLREAMNAVASLAARAGHEAALPLEVMVAALRAQVSTGGGVQRFLAGGVTFCTLTPMRGIPFQVVCLLGMNDTAFPRADRPSDFDLTATRFRGGDRTRRADDRYLFLETLLGTRRTLYVSHVGQDIRDNAALPPSTLVLELLDCIDQTFVPAGGGRARDLLLVRHPLQSFSRRYFDGSDARLWSYDDGLRAALAGRGSRAVEPLFPAPLPSPGAEWLDVDLDSLVRFFQNPSRFLLEQRLGVRLPRVEGEVETSEPFAVGGLEGWRLRDSLVTAALDGDADGGLELVRAAGLLPHGRVGELVGAAARDEARAFAARVAPALSRPLLPEPVTLEIVAHGVTLRAALGDVRADGRFEYTPGTLGGRAVIALWLRHLVLCAAAPDGVEARSRLVDRDGVLVMQPVAVAEAAETLKVLVSLFTRGSCEPLPFFPRCAWRYLEASRKGRPDPLADAGVEWRGNDFLPGSAEGDDPWFALAFRDRDPPVDERFAAVVRTVYAGLEYERDQA